MKRSEQCEQLYAALALARANFGKAERTKEAKISGEKASYTYKYAPLEECFKAIDQALSDQGLALVGGVEYGEDGRLWVITHLGHTSGQWIENALDCGTPKDIKAMGGMLTYARRYGVTLTVQMHAEDDDDGPRGDEGSLDRRPARKAPPKSIVAPETPATGTRGSDSISPLPTTKPTGEEVSQLMELLRGTYPNEKTVETQVRALLTTLPPNVAFEDRRVKMLMTRDAYTRLQDAATAYALEHANPDDDVPITTGPDTPESPESNESLVGNDIPAGGHEDVATGLVDDLQDNIGDSDDIPRTEVDADGFVLQPLMTALELRAVSYGQEPLLQQILGSAKLIKPAIFRYAWVQVATKKAAKV